MALNQSLITSYRNNVYLYGTRELNNNKGDAVPDIHPTYVEAVMQDAAFKLTFAQIENARVLTYITQEEFDATIAYNPSIVPASTTTEEVV